MAFAFSEFREEANLEGRSMLKKEKVSLWGGGGAKNWKIVLSVNA